MKNIDPKVSVIVPVYNVELYLSQCIDSLINQTLSDIEIILVDDGSTDKSKGICDEYTSKDERIKVFHIENSGVSNARNFGISNSIGEYIMFLDSDDWIEPETIEMACNKADESDANIVFWSWQKEYSSGTYKDFYLENNSAFLSDNDINKLRIRCIGFLDDELNDPVKTDHFNTPWAKLYSRSFLVNSNVKFIERKQVGMEDVLFNIELFQKVEKVAYLPRYYNHYRIDNPNSLTKIDTIALNDKFSNLFNAIDNIGCTHPNYREAINNRVAMSIINIILSIASPKSGYGFKESVYQTTKLLQTERTKKALKSLKFNTLPYHWKVFFFLCKYRFASGVYLLALAMRKLKRKI